MTSLYPSIILNPTPSRLSSLSSTPSPKGHLVAMAGTTGTHGVTVIDVVEAREKFRVHDSRESNMPCQSLCFSSCSTKLACAFAPYHKNEETVVTVVAVDVISGRENLRVRAPLRNIVTERNKMDHLEVMWSTENNAIGMTVGTNSPRHVVVPCDAQASSLDWPALPAFRKDISVEHCFALPTLPHATQFIQFTEIHVGVKGYGLFGKQAKIADALSRGVRLPRTLKLIGARLDTRLRSGGSGVHLDAWHHILSFLNPSDFHCITRTSIEVSGSYCDLCGRSVGCAGPIEIHERYSNEATQTRLWCDICCFETFVCEFEDCCNLVSLRNMSELPTICGDHGPLCLLCGRANVPLAGYYGVCAACQQGESETVITGLRRDFS